MTILVATDSFKGTLSAAQACAAVAGGLRRALPTARVEEIPLADGGEGTMDILVKARRGSYRELAVRGPFGAPVGARYGILDEGKCAVIEMAAASGLLLVPPLERDVMQATSFGTGELMRGALRSGARRLLVAIGGSASCDGGCGCAQALGVRFLCADGSPLPDGIGGGQLAAIDRIDAREIEPALTEATVEVLCDVRNPLVGTDGAAPVYAPQKGATPEQVMLLQQNLEHLARLIARDRGREVAHLPGSGAAGGLGAGLHAFAGGCLGPGAERVLDAVGFPTACRDADAIVTGEGTLDGQSLEGKVISAVASLGRRTGVPVYVLAGRVELAEAKQHKHFAGVAAVTPGALRPAHALAEEAVKQAQRWFGT